MSDLAGCRILVVEDSYLLADDVARALCREGADVLGPCSRRDQATALLERAPHCALLDINLGEGISFELADRLREHGVPFLFFTGYNSDVIPARFAAVASLRKPVSAARLVQAVAALRRLESSPRVVVPVTASAPRPIAGS